MLDNWDKYDQKGMGWICHVHSLQVFLPRGTGRLVPASGTGLRTGSPLRALRQLRQLRRNRKQTQASTTQNKMSLKEDENRRNA